MQYLVDRYDPEYKFSYPKDSREYWEMTNWVCFDYSTSHSAFYFPLTPFGKLTMLKFHNPRLPLKLMWQMGGLGPMQGQANHFVRYAPEKIQYGIDRYRNETRRLYRVMDTQLAKTRYLVGDDKPTIADFACWGWVAAYSWCGVPNFDTDFPHLKEWLFRLKDRPNLIKGANVPDRFTMLDNIGKSEEELEKAAEASKKWVQAGMKEDAK